MKSTICLLAIALLWPTINHAQKPPVKFGVTAIENFSSITLFNPQRSQDGKTQYNTVALPGVGLFWESNLLKRLSQRFDVAFLSKGSELPFQTGDLFGPVGNIQRLTLQDKFRFVSVGECLKWNIAKSTRPVRSFFLAGANADFLVGKRIESDVYPLNQDYPQTSYHDFKKFTVSMSIGTGVSFKNSVDAYFAWNRDVTDFVHQPDLEVRSWVWQLGLDFNLNSLIKI